MLLSHSGVLEEQFNDSSHLWRISGDTHYYFGANYKCDFVAMSYDWSKWFGCDLGQLMLTFGWLRTYSMCRRRIWKAKRHHLLMTPTVVAPSALATQQHVEASPSRKCLTRDVRLKRRLLQEHEEAAWSCSSAYRPYPCSLSRCSSNFTFVLHFLLLNWILNEHNYQI